MLALIDKHDTQRLLDIAFDSHALLKLEAIESDERSEEAA